MMMTTLLHLTRSVGKNNSLQKVFLELMILSNFDRFIVWLCKQSDDPLPFYEA